MLRATLTSALDAAQARLIFGRTRVIRSVPPGPWAGRHEVETLWHEVGDGAVLQGWAARPTAAPSDAACDAGRPAVLVYFGGRNEHAVWAPGIASYLGPWVVYAFNYRGFGASTGRATEARAKRDAERILAEVCRREGGRPPVLALMGRSLGTAVALSAARSLAPDRLVLLSPFDSVGALLSARRGAGLVRTVLRQRFECEADAQALQAPTLVLLAEHEQRVPHAHSLRLATHLQALQGVLVMPGTTHRTLPREPATLQAVATFLNSATQPSSVMALSCHRHAALTDGP
jgi:pimeloyl-ACP methyl ester carboxylesterase